MHVVVYFNFVIISIHTTPVDDVIPPVCQYSVFEMELIICTDFRLVTSFRDLPERSV